MPVHCLYGTETDTDEAYVYDVPRFTTTTPPAPKTIISGPGDGTVNLRSLHACDRLGPQVYHCAKIYIYLLPPSSTFLHSGGGGNPPPFLHVSFSLQKSVNGEYHLVSCSRQYRTSTQSQVSRIIPVHGTKGCVDKMSFSDWKTLSSSACKQFHARCSDF